MSHYLIRKGPEIVSFGQGLWIPDPGDPGLVRETISKADADRLSGRLRAFWWDGALAERTPAPLAVPRTSFAADGEDVLLINGVPQSAVLSMSLDNDAQRDVVEDGTVEITSTRPQSIRVTLRMPPPYLDWQETFHAT